MSVCRQGAYPLKTQLLDFLAFTFIILILFAASAMAGEDGVLTGPLVVSENWPECTDLVTWMQDVMRLEGLQAADDTAQAKAFFRWLRLFNRMATGGMIQAVEGEYGEEDSVLDAHKNLFVYGWGFCDTHSRIAEAVWQEFKEDPNVAQRVITKHEDGGYHTMYRLNLDGKWGAFDARYGYYLIAEDSPDARVLDWVEVGVDENILKNQTFKYRSQPFFEYFGREWERALLLNPVFYNSQKEWEEAGSPIECVFADPMYKMGTRYHDMAFHIPKGATIERYWNNSARQFYVPARVVEEPFRPSGRFYRVTETMLDGNWVKYDPNYGKCAAYVTTVPLDEGYKDEVAGGKTIGQAWGKFIYSPDWSNLSSLEGSGIQGDMVYSREAPHLRPKELETSGEAVFDFYNPYVWVNGTLSGEIAAKPDDAVRLEIRTLLPKPRNAEMPDVWSKWQTLHTGGGPFRLELGRERFNSEDVSIHGIYRFQLRMVIPADPLRREPVGLSFLRLDGYFENGIMSIPRIVEGHNTIHFKVADAAGISGPIEIIYSYQTPSGEKSHRQTLYKSDFKSGVATYSFEAPNLTRCNSLIIRYW
ncbi:MAG TPA: hypothetical protein P5568_01525 [Acidobacteriota bacterium]|nr:hypothetical protein [Acidobacteriota bacterium]HRV07122.1 hypothetical protein [Acidobacteriota bacterium]